MKNFTKTFVAGMLIAVVGAGLLISMVRSMRTSEISTPSLSISPKALAATVPTKIEGNPVKIDIPSLGISLDIIPGVYDSKTGKWTLTTDKVQYATVTPEPNNLTGNTFLYGHYRKNVFASLHTIKPEAVATVTTDNGHVFYYQFVKSTVVDPTDSDGVFNYQGKPILTVQTCTGAMFQKRQLFTFDLVRVV